MAANEIIANVALEKMGYEKGRYDIVEPHDDLNMSQSTNDFYPTALKVAMLRYDEPLLEELDALAAAFEAKGDEFKDVLKMGRTELQDAVPMTVGQEMRAFGSALRAQSATIRTLEAELYGINMGGTAIGTGLNAADGFPEYCAAHLAELTGKPIRVSDDLIAATSDLHAFVMYSSALRGLAARLAKTANDLILLSSGPRTGLYELNLPAMQPGSSIMPGKVNPVMPELVNCVAMQVIGNDVTVAHAQTFGQLQLNAYEPVVAAAILESQVLLINTMRTFREKCVEGISVNADHSRQQVENSIGIVTALNPVLGYDTSTEVAAEALKSGRGVLEIVRERGLLDEKQLQEILDPETMTGQK
jgi:aspartate ammonia-lyase